MKSKRMGRNVMIQHPINKPTKTSGGCQGVNNQGNPCKVKDSTARTHADKCQREEKDFCWMHCDCSYCSQLMGGAVKTQGRYYKEMKQ